MDLSVILPVINEGENLRVLIPRLSALLRRLGLVFEIVVVDGGSRDGTAEIASALGARVVGERRRGYAGALATGFEEAQGDYVLTLDADLSHEPDFVAKLWRARDRGDIVIASRYVRGGIAYAPFLRRFLSQVLNTGLRLVLSMPFRDLSSGYRLYRKAALAGLNLESRNFEVLEEILVKAYAQGYSVVEVPFVYFPRESGRSHARLLRFGWDLTRSAFKLWKLRNSLACADYDERAFFSRIPLQRFWHHRRRQIVMQWARGSERVLDDGCGSSMIIQSLNNAMGVDPNFNKLRYLRRRGIPLFTGAPSALPFKDESFDCVICVQLIARIPRTDAVFAEMNRILQSGGTLIIGAPDAATVGWRIIEPIYTAVVPDGYRNRHLAHYTREDLSAVLSQHGFAVEEVAYIARSEMVMRCRKLEAGAPAAAALAGDYSSSAASGAA